MATGDGGIFFLGEILAGFVLHFNGHGKSIARISTHGRRSFLQYLDNLEIILKSAQGHAVSHI